MIGKCPKCHKVITIYNRNFFNVDISKLGTIKPKCKHCKVSVDWSIPEQKANLIKWLMPIVSITALLMIIFQNGFSLILFILFVPGFIAYIGINPPRLVKKMGDSDSNN